MGSISDRMEAWSHQPVLPTPSNWKKIVKDSVETYVCTQCSETIPENFVKKTHFECHRCKKGFNSKNCDCSTTVEVNCPNCNH